MQFVIARCDGIEDGRDHIGQYILPDISTSAQPLELFICFKERIALELAHRPHQE